MRIGRRAVDITTDNPVHISSQGRESIPGFMRRAVLHLAAGMALEELAERLQRFQPTSISGYPSVIDLLAKAQLAGELNIAPLRVTTGAETQPAGFRERARAAWKAEVFSAYGFTQAGMCASECPEHAGMHIDEDAVILEVVDERNRVLPAGQEGDAVRVTNLLNETLPIIRYRVDDLLRIDDAPCACGAPFARIVSIEGRRSEWLSLRSASGASVSVRPSVLEGPLQAMLDVRRFQLRNLDGACHVFVAPHRSAIGLDATIRQALVAALAPHAVPAEARDVTLVETIDEERGRTDKRQRVVRR